MNVVANDDNEIDNAIHVVAANDDDNIDDANSPTGCENLIGDLDSIEDEYYQAKSNSKDDACSTNITNDGEILSLPLFSSICRVQQSDEEEEHRVEQSDEEEEHHEANNDEIDNKVYQVDQSDDIDNAKSPLIGDLDGIKDECYQVKGNNKEEEEVADIGYDGVPDDNDNYGVIYDRIDDANSPSLPPESNTPCIHFINITNDSLVSDEVNALIEEVNEEYPFWRPHRDEEYPV